MTRSMPVGALNDIHREQRRNRRASSMPPRQRSTSSRGESTSSNEVTNMQYCLCGSQNDLKGRTGCVLCLLLAFQSIILIAFVLYDLGRISQFEKSYDSEEQEIYSKDYELNERREKLKELHDQYEVYAKQKPMAVAIFILLLIYIVTTVILSKGFKTKNRQYFLPFLFLAFPVLTCAMVYAILYKPLGESGTVYGKILSIVVIYTLTANIYRVVYREYHSLKLGSRRTSDGNEAIPSVSESVQPVVIKMKPPPYKNKPPPYTPDQTGNTETNMAEDNAGTVVVDIPTDSPQVHTQQGTDSPQVHTQQGTDSPQVHSEQGAHSSQVHTQQGTENRGYLPENLSSVSLCPPYSQVEGGTPIANQQRTASGIPPPPYVESESQITSAQPTY